MAKIRKSQRTPLVLLRKKRVAAYARVSSGKDAMLHSLSAQVSYYGDLIQRHADWEFAGVYADEALTGTKDERPEFQRLLADCRTGKIDMVITKSISRFARNTVTLLEATRGLKAIGVDVFFEEQGIHTLSGEGEMILTLLASVAQEESRTVSENCKWRIRNKFKNGELVGLRRMFGYNISRRGITVNPEQAAVVRMIFDDYLGGLGCSAIASKLRRMSIPTVYGAPWSPHGVNTILRNEKYTGNAILQKRYTKDHLSKKRACNRGALPQFYAEGTHEGIISEDTFRKAQALRESRRAAASISTRSPVNYPLTGMIVCGGCGKHYKRKATPYGAYWQCRAYLVYGKDICSAKRIPEDTLYVLIAEVLGIPQFDADAFRTRVRELRVLEGNRISFIMRDGVEVEAVWRDKSRKDSWTPEMRQQARERMLTRREGS